MRDCRVKLRDRASMDIRAAQMEPHSLRTGHSGQTDFQPGRVWPGEKVISRRTVVLDMLTYGLAPSLCTLRPPGHMGSSCEHELRNQGRSQSAQQAWQTQGPVKSPV